MRVISSWTTYTIECGQERPEFETADFAQRVRDHRMKAEWYIS